MGGGFEAVRGLIKSPTPRKLKSFSEVEYINPQRGYDKIVLDRALQMNRLRTRAVLTRFPLLEKLESYKGLLVREISGQWATECRWYSYIQIKSKWYENTAGDKRDPIGTSAAMLKKLTKKGKFSENGQLMRIRKRDGSALTSRIYPVTQDLRPKTKTVVGEKTLIKEKEQERESMSKWKCAHCTFENESGEDKCICGNVKGSVKQWSCEWCTTKNTISKSCHVCAKSRGTRPPSAWECPQCDVPNAASAEMCCKCNFIQIGVEVITCHDCGLRTPASQKKCRMDCRGWDKWDCIYCARVNNATEAKCKQCAMPQNSIRRRLATNYKLMERLARLEGRD